MICVFFGKEIEGNEYRFGMGWGWVGVGLGFFGSMKIFGFRLQIEYEQIQKMKNSSINLLYKGQRRKVQKQQYLKLRTYNKIKTCRTNRYDESNISNLNNTNSTNMSSLSTSSRALNRSEISCDQLVEVNDQMRKESISLFQENRTLLKYVRKCQKIDRLILKKFPFLGDCPDTQPSVDQEDICEEKEKENCQNALNYKEFELMLEFKLALDVIQLEECLEQKQQIMKTLQSNKRRGHEQTVIDSLFKQKIKFLSTIYLEPNSPAQKLQQFSMQDSTLKQYLATLLSKQKLLKKQKQTALKNMEQSNYELKQVQQSAEQRKKRLRKNSCQFIEIQNGEIKSQQDLKRQLQELKEKRKIEGQQLQVYLEQKMMEKIALLNLIEKQEVKCNFLGIKKVMK